ncbi:ribonuclease P [Candidatus Woesearchaeota archaeon]|nr:ribonuclease P [Candidatus Woesearchaeota archaeon]MBT7368263.1 ribonuclease P [Candidatus Woesearchaeota archaeon]
MAESKNKNQIGFEGTIIDETKNTITIKTNQSNDDQFKKKLIKNQITIIIKNSNKKIEMKKLIMRPEDRIKKA